MYVQLTVGKKSSVKLWEGSRQKDRNAPGLVMVSLGSFCTAPRKLATMSVTESCWIPSDKNNESNKHYRLKDSY